MKNILLWVLCLVFVGCPSESPAPPPPAPPVPEPQRESPNSSIAGKWKAGQFELHFEKLSNRFDAHCRAMQIQGSYKLIGDKLKLELDPQTTVEEAFDFFDQCGDYVEWLADDQGKHFTIPIRLPVEDSLILYAGPGKSVIAHMSNLSN